MRALLLTAAFGVGLVVAAPRAEARVVRFLGPHPIAPSLGEGMCHIEGPHVHAYAPHKSVLYVRRGPAYVFVGDPVEFEPKPPKHAYYGHHPVFWAGDEAADANRYCYLGGPHFHWYAPPVTLRAKFTSRGGAFWYVGGHPKGYRRNHWRGAALAGHYRGAGLYVAPPVITVGPPVGWVGLVVAPVEVKLKLKGPHGHLKLKGGVPWGHFRVKGHGHGHGPGHVKIKVKGGHGKGHFKFKGYDHGMGHGGMGHGGMGHGHGGGHVKVKVKGGHGHGEVKVKW